ncbi:replication initiator [Catenulispora acidiphila]|uniref:replication initiator n=1 Tax=Catenulispora acidiphila TaxID=304895 RepID=UPI00295294BA|nr:replication initiator [Catenulispora acidiphila]
MAATGVRGRLGVEAAVRRVRSTRRRQDASELPKRPVSARTVGKIYEAAGGKKFRPSMFLTLTLDSYGRVTKDGTPVALATYDCQRAARDAIHFARLVDRFVQNLRRLFGFDVQYFAAVESQRRLAAAPAHGDPQHHLPRRTSRSHHRDLPPGLVAFDRRAGVRRPAA